MTTEGGLDTAGQSRQLVEILDMQSASIPVSLFIDADVAQIKASDDVKAEFIELHTIVSRAALVGLERAVREMKQAMRGL